MPGVTSEEYFSLIRNFRRHAFLLMTLFGASPAVCSSFVEGRQHDLQTLAEFTRYMPHGTSLRMGRLGYQSDAQSSLAVSFNSLEGYGASLQDALTRSYPAYEAIGIQNPGGDYNQLATTLLQIENEFYGTIRPKRVIQPGERPLHALRERGVEYVEVRLMDLDPFVPVGITEATTRFIDVFLLHCLMSDSPPDSAEEIAALGRNQHKTAARGREPGLTLERVPSVALERDGAEVSLMDWGLEVIGQCVPIAAAMDSALGGKLYADAVAAAQQSLQHPDTLPSARVLAVMDADFNNSFVGFLREQSRQTQTHLLALPFSNEQQARYEAMVQQSINEQKRLEASDSMSFETYRQNYVSPQRLGVSASSVDTG